MNDFQYHLELAKKEFQSNVNGLLEVHSILLNKLNRCKTTDKKGIFIETHEAEIIISHILETTSSLMTDYETISRTLRFQDINYKATMRVFDVNLPDKIRKFKNNEISQDELSLAIREFINA
jgi:hypothetical protein